MKSLSIIFIALITLASCSKKEEVNPSSNARMSTPAVEKTIKIMFTSSLIDARYTVIINDKNVKSIILYQKNTEVTLKVKAGDIVKTKNILRPEKEVGTLSTTIVIGSEVLASGVSTEENEVSYHGTPAQTLYVDVVIP